jgi:hypothetical protein
VYRRNLAAAVGAAVLLALAGTPAAVGEDKPKGNPLVVIPDAKDVAEVRVVRYAAKQNFDRKLTKQAQFQPVLDWLKAIDWEKTSGEDIKRLKVVAQLNIIGEITITKKDKTTLHFDLQPDRIIEGDHRWKADMKKLDAAVKKAR